VSKIDEQDQPDEDEEEGSNGNDPAAVEHEETVGNQKGEEAKQEE